jgi:hypothetical protein
VDNWNNITNSQNRVRKKSFGGTSGLSQPEEMIMCGTFFNSWLAEIRLTEVSGKGLIHLIYVRMYVYPFGVFYLTSRLLLIF